jgi:alkylation response protein AidB-like acyl-CoA dehydrogenase
MSFQVSTATADIDDLISFRHRACEWLKRNMPPIDVKAPSDTESGEESWARTRKLQAILYDGGFAGICYPREYGGQGLTPEHQQVFSEESLQYEMPLPLNIPTLSIILPSILRFGTEVQKRQHVDAVLRGNEILVELLSEPHAGSDMASTRTRADWSGTNWVLNGSKIWTSNAYVADYAQCLARTNWDLPKHDGLTMFLIPIRHPGITVRRIRQANGKSHFCEEFLDNVVLGPDAVLGEVNRGWAVASHRFYYSRTALGGGNPYVSGNHDLSVALSRGKGPGGSLDLLTLSRQIWGAAHCVPDAVVDAYVAETVREHLAKRITGAVKSGLMAVEAASMLRLFHAETDWLCTDAALEIMGSYAATGSSIDNAGEELFSQGYLFRQATSIGGGTTEMARNAISERVLRMPREAAPDLKIPFKEVRSGRRDVDVRM